MMDIKKIDKIKAPEDWVEEALNPEKIQGISHRRNSMKKLRTAAAAVVIFLLCGTFVTVAATKSNVFQLLLENMFGKGKCHRGGVKSRTNETGGRR